MAASLQQHEVPFDPTWTKELLLQAIHHHTIEREEEFQTDIIDKAAKDSEVEILRLPPFHCQFSAMKLFWGWLKKEVAKEAYPNVRVEELRDLRVQSGYIDIVLRKKPTKKPNSVRSSLQKMNEPPQHFLHNWVEQCKVAE